MVQPTPSPRGWSKIGPGLGVDFDASPAEIQAVFEDYLLPEYGPYEWLTFESVWEEGKVVGRTWSSVPINKTADFLHSSLTTAVQSFDLRLRSMQLNPNPEWETWTFSEHYCGLCGMPAFKRHKRPSDQEPYRLGMVWKAGDFEQTVVRENLEYRRIFERLRRQLRKYKPTIIKYPPLKIPPK